MKRVVYGFGLVVAGFAVALWTSPVQAACIAGGALSDINDCVTAAKGGDECLLVWHVDGDGAGGPPLDKKGNVTKSKIECTDGQPCDSDGLVDGKCTFSFGACVNATGTPSGGKACTVGTNLTTLELKKPSDKDAINAIKRPEAFFVKRIVTDEIGDGLLPTAATMCTAEDLEIEVKLRSKGGVCNSPAGLKCSGDAGCDDYCVPAYKKNKTLIKATVSDGASTKDSDALKFFCLPAAAPGQGAEALELAAAAGATSADLIGGPMALARLEKGDHLLRNGDIRVIVRGPGRERSNMYQQGGHIIDADIVRADPADDRDNLSGIQHLIQVSSTQATDTVVVLNDGANGAPAIVRTSGPDTVVSVVNPDIALYATGEAGGPLTVPLDAVDNDLPIDLQTDYILRPGTNYVQAITTITNNGATDLSIYVGGFLNPAGLLEAFGPGVGFGDPLLRPGSNSPTTSQAMQHFSFQGRGDAAGVAYGVVFPSSTLEGPAGTGIFHQSGVFVWSDGVPLLNLLNNPQSQKPSSLALQVPAGGQNSFRQWFVVGETIADVTRARAEIYGDGLGAIQGTVTVAGQPAPGARVSIIRGACPNGVGGTQCKSVYSATVADQDGFYRVFVPQGGYEVTVRADGTPYDTGNDLPSFIGAAVKKKKTVVVDVDLPSTGRLRVLTKDSTAASVAAKISVVGKAASPDPLAGQSIGGFIDAIGRIFGSPIEDQDKEIFGLVAVKFTDLSGDTGEFDLQPGTYQIVVSKGHEYDVHSERVTIVAGATTTVNATVTHVVDTTGFISIDTHVHTLRSPDSRISERDRVVTMLAEGVDFFASTDHGFVTDMSPTVAALGATAQVKTAPSEETTSFAYGHYNIWPRVIDANERTGGATDWGGQNGFPSGGSYNVTPDNIFNQFNPANQVIQINHFNGGQGGQFFMFGTDFEAVPPLSSNVVYRCSGTPQAAVTPRAGLPCKPDICIGGAEDALACTGGCPGGFCLTERCSGGADDGLPCTGGCPGGLCNTIDDCLDDSITISVCEPIANTLASQLRLDPAETNLHSNNFTALEVFIEHDRSQAALALGDNLADWAGLLNQGIFKAGIADSDTHSVARVPAGAPRSFVASSAADASAIDPTVTAQTVNAGRVIGSGGLFMTVELEGLAGATATHALGNPLTVEAATGGADLVNIHVESPTWAQFDTIEVYANSSLDCVSEITPVGVLGRTCTVTPIATVGVTPATVAGFAGGSKLSADTSVALTITEDTWVIVVARGTDGTSRPLFPMNPQELDEFGNQAADPLTRLNQLTDFGVAPPWNLNQGGNLAIAFSNPLFFDFGGDGLCHNGVACP